MVVEKDNVERETLGEIVSSLERRAANGLPWKMDASTVRTLYRYISLVTEQNAKAFALIDMLSKQEDEVEGAPV